MKNAVSQSKTDKIKPKIQFAKLHQFGPNQIDQRQQTKWTDTKLNTKLKLIEH